MTLQERMRQLRDVFSVRHEAHGPGYKPDAISDRLRNRILMLYADIISGRMTTGYGVGGEDNSHQFWEELHHAVGTALGRPRLSRFETRSREEDAKAFVHHASAADLFTFIEAGFKLQISFRIFHDENEFVDALNDIFRSEASPYQVTHGVHRREPLPRGGHSIIRVAFPRVVRVDEEVAHVEAVEPALSALSDPAYAAASDEFRKALEDYHQGDFEDCLGKCGSAFESVLKVLCTKNKIPFDPNKDAAPPLLDKVLPRSTLDTGTFKDPLIAVARMRNRLSSSHGGGTSVRKVRPEFAGRGPAPSACLGCAGQGTWLVWGGLRGLFHPGEGGKLNQFYPFKIRKKKKTERGRTPPPFVGGF